MTFAHRCAALVVAGLMLSGCSAAETPAAVPPTTMPSPGAEESMPTLIDEEWDVVVRREFAGVECVAYVRANGDGPDADSARAFLQGGDWSSVEVSLDEYSEEDLDRFRGRGASDASLLVRLIADRVNQDFADAGLLTVDVSLEGETRC